MRYTIEAFRGRRWPGRAVLVAALAGLWLVAIGSPAGAHALLRDSDPAAGASLDQAPRRVVLTFTERPEVGLSSIQVLDTSGRRVEQGQATPVQNEALDLAVGLGDLADGTYTVSWRVVSKDDGHVTAGSFAFGVGVPATGTAEQTQSTAPQGETPSPSPAATAARLALYAGLTLLVGAAVTGLAVSGRMLPPGARPLLAVGAGLALVGGAGRFLAEQARIDAPLGTLLASTTGQGLLRLATGVVVTAIATWFLATAPDGERVDTWRLALVGATAGITLLLHVDVGHAAGPSPLRTLNLLIQWLHVLAVGASIGGLVWLLAWLRGRERPEQAEAVVRFSRLAAPVLGLVAFTCLSWALLLSGGWDGLLHSSYGRLLDVKMLLFLGLVALGALNRYRVVPALAAGIRGLDHLRRNVRGEVALAACILTVTAVLSQLPPGKFVVQQASAKPPAPPSVQVEGSDFATAVRINLTASPGTPGPNTFTAKVTDYDSGEDWPATRVSLRFTPRGNPDVGASTLELSKAEDGLWKGQGSQLSIAGTWSVVGLVEGSGPAVTVPLELKTRTAPQAVKVSEAPGQPTLYTITLAAGGTLQGYIDPGRPGPNTVHFTYFNQGGDEQPADKASARMTGPSGKSEALTLVRLGPGHFAANVDLDPGRVSFAIEATAARVHRGGQFQQVIG